MLRAQHVPIFPTDHPSGQETELGVRSNHPPLFLTPQECLLLNTRLPAPRGHLSETQADRGHSGLGAGTGEEGVMLTGAGFCLGAMGMS